MDTTNVQCPSDIRNQTEVGCFAGLSVASAFDNSALIKILNQGVMPSTSIALQCYRMKYLVRRWRCVCWLRFSFELCFTSGGIMFISTRVTFVDGSRATRLPRSLCVTIITISRSTKLSTLGRTTGRGDTQWCRWPPPVVLVMARPYGREIGSIIGLRRGEEGVWRIVCRRRCRHRHRCRSE